MKHNIYIIIAAAAIVGLTSCESESTFSVSEKKGAVNCERLDVDYVNSGRQTRANGSVSLNDFTVKFVNETGETKGSYKYSEMPQVVTLPVGTYTAIAEYGSDSETPAWDAPYYKGISQQIIIKENEIADAPATVMCKLQNIRVKVNADGLGSNVTEGWKVTINVGTSSMDYAKANSNQACYFKYEEGSNTITATFTGTVNGTPLTNVLLKTYENAAPGNSYTINLSINKPENDENGGIDLGNRFTLVTDINVKDENMTVDPDKPYDDIITDADRNNDRNTPNDNN